MSENRNTSVSCSCSGCLITILSFILLLWIVFHLSEIAAFVTG